MGVTAGDLRRRVQVLRWNASAPDGFGGEVGEYEELGTPIPAHRADVSDGERWHAGRLEGELVSRFTVRASTFTRGIRRTDRLLHEGVEYEIDGIKQVGDGRAFLEITAWAAF